jgi:hypothetical protein
MTFLLSEINHFGIVMASDSSETRTAHGKSTFTEVEKTHYFSKLNVGISTWGHAIIDGQGIGIDEWLRETVEEFTHLGNTDGILSGLTSHLAVRLDEAFYLNGSNRSKIRMGLHIAGYDSSTSDAPGICHVFIDQDHLRFDSQQIQLRLPEHYLNQQLRNGMLDEYGFDEFAIMWPALSGVFESFRNVLLKRYSSITQPLQYSPAVQAELLGNWVKQLCVVVKLAGIPEHIGKAVRVLTFDKSGNPQRFILPEMIESDSGSQQTD